MELLHRDLIGLGKWTPAVAEILRNSARPRPEKECLLPFLSNVTREHKSPISVHLCWVNTVVLSLFIDLIAIWIYLQTLTSFSAPYSWANTWLMVSYYMLKSLISQSLLFHERLQSCSFQWLSYPNQLWVPSHLVEKPPVSNRHFHIYLGHFWILKFHVLVGIDNSPKKICCILLRTFASVFIRDIDV